MRLFDVAGQLNPVLPSSKCMNWWRGQQEWVMKWHFTCSQLGQVRGKPGSCTFSISMKRAACQVAIAVAPTRAAKSCGWKLKSSRSRGMNLPIRRWGQRKWAWLSCLSQSLLSIVFIFSLCMSRWFFFDLPLLIISWEAWSSSQVKSSNNKSTPPSKSANLCVWLCLCQYPFFVAFSCSCLRLFVCVWVSLCVCAVVYHVSLLHSLRKKNRRVYLCACIATIQVITCIAAVQISLFADCCQQPMSPSRPTYIKKTVNRATGVSNQSRPMHNINKIAHLISLTPVMRTM